MRFPNQRYGNPVAFQHYSQGVPLAALARHLRRDERTVRDWLSGAQRVPFWVPELMRLRQLEDCNELLQMNAIQGYVWPDQPADDAPTFADVLVPARVFADLAAALVASGEPRAPSEPGHTAAVDEARSRTVNPRDGILSSYAAMVANYAAGPTSTIVVRFAGSIAAASEGRRREIPPHRMRRGSSPVIRDG